MTNFFGRLRQSLLVNEACGAVGDGKNGMDGPKDQCWDGRFDEETYLTMYQDVDRNVELEQFPSGEAHFKAYRFDDGRNVFFDGLYQFNCIDLHLMQALLPAADPARNIVTKNKLSSKGVRTGLRRLLDFNMLPIVYIK